MLSLFYEKLKAHETLSRYYIQAEEERKNVITLRGLVDTWKDAVNIGQIAGKLENLKGVVNNIDTAGSLGEKTKRQKLLRDKIQQARTLGKIGEADVVIVGCGISGSAIARTLAKYHIRIIVAEKMEDISEGTTKANNGMIHAGQDPKHGTLKAKLSVPGNAMFHKWAQELSFDLRQTGLILNTFDKNEDQALENLFQNGIKNGVPGIQLLSRDEALKIEPCISAEIRRALWAPTAAFVEPYEVVQALMENAVDNGVVLMRGTEVLGIDSEDGAVQAVLTDKGLIKTSCVINAAGLYADEIASMVDDQFYTIHPRRGVLLIFDRSTSKDSADVAIGVMPSEHSKGGGNMKTTADNPLWGPSARETPDKDDFSVNEDEFESVISLAFTKGIKRNDIIAYFTGIRAAVHTEDFVIEPSEKVKGFIHVAGIQSPGLACAPAIAQMVEEIYLSEYPETNHKANYNPYRKEPIKFARLPKEEQHALIQENPQFGNIVCRCECVTEAEIVTAINGSVGAGTMDGVKRRTRCGMGRCHGGFCGPKVMRLLSRELDIPITDITKRGLGSEMIVGVNRDAGDGKHEEA